MPNKTRFNRGTLNIDDQQVSWTIKTDHVQCISINELHYLKKENPISIPVDDIKLDNDQLKFTWKIEEKNVPITEIRKRDIWFQLKVAKNFIETIQYFEKSDKFFTVYQLENFYVDKNSRVKTLLSTRANQLPYHENASEHIEVIKQIIINIFSKKSIDQHFIEQIKQASHIQNLDDIITNQYEQFIRSLDKEREKSFNKLRKTKRNYVLISSCLMIIVILATYYFVNDQKQIDEIHGQKKQLEDELSAYEQVTTSYNAFFAGDAKKALAIVEQLKEDNESEAFNDDYYLSLLIQNGEFEKALKQYPSEAHQISEDIFLMLDEEEFLDLDINNPYIQLEQSILKDDHEQLQELIPSLTELTERQQEKAFEYYKVQDLDEAIEFAIEYQNEGLLVDALKSKKKSLEKEKKKLKKKKHKKKRQKIKQEIETLEEQLEQLK